MPAYSFKEMFVPMILDGTKRQTIRARRKHAPRVGQIAYHYFGMRTKHCRKLGEAPITAVNGIYIDANRIIIYERALILPELYFARWNPLNSKNPGFTLLGLDYRNELAWKDGFRPAGNCAYNEGAFDLMLSFWNNTHSLPFVGDVIYW